MNKLLQDGSDLQNNYFSNSFKHYPTLMLKRRTCNVLLFLFVIVPFISLLILRAQYESVTGTNYQSIFDKIFYTMMFAFFIITPFFMHIEKKMRNVLLSPTHHLVYSKCELKKMLSVIESASVKKDENLNINTNDKLYHELKKLHSLIEQYSLAYVTNINTQNLKNMNFSLSLNELEKQISNTMSEVFEDYNKKSKLEELEFEIKKSNVKCFDSVNHHKLTQLTEKCFKVKELPVNKLNQKDNFSHEKTTNSIIKY